MTTRRITLDGPCNFRDLGGYSTVDGAMTRWGRLYRSDSMHTLTDADVPVLKELGVSTAVDFRSAHEIDAHGIGPLHDAAIHYVHAPTFDATRRSEAPDLIPEGDWTASDFYILMMANGAPAYADAANAIAGADALPAVFFCMAGKDRTGVFAAVVLGLLGVPDDVIVADYVLTHERLEIIAQRRVAFDGEDGEAVRWEGIPSELKGAHETTMRGLIELVHTRWGGWEGYAEFAGIPSSTVDELRAQLLDR